MADKQDISTKAMRLRQQLGIDGLSPVDIPVLAQTIQGLTLAYYPLPDEISGACYKGESSSMLILINSGMSLGRQHFSLAHELYHAFYDRTLPKFVCPSNFGSRDENERTADMFASFFLMPDLAVENAITKFSKPEQKIEMECVIRLEQYFGVSHSSMLIRLKELQFLTESDVAAMQSGVKLTAARIGFDTSLYEPSHESEKIKVLGYYIDKARTLAEKDIISNGLYEELLLDAFREDLVFDQQEEMNENV